MPERPRYFTMGNALVVPLVKAMGKRISALAEDEQRFLEPLADLVARRVTLADLAERGEEA